jgi:aspartate aminotransferase
VAGHLALREAAAGYWTRRGLPTSPNQVVCGPGSKPLLFGLLLALGNDVAVPRPSWVSYAAQAAMIGARPHFVPAAPGEGGIPDPAALAATAAVAAAAGRRIGSVVVTLPDNPTGRVPTRVTVRELCQVAAAHGLIIISDEIYRDLVHDRATPVLSPAQVAPQHAVVTTGLSKSLALGGWRLGAARMPDGPLGDRLRRGLLGAASEIWSAPAAPVQHAAALAFTEPAQITKRIAASRSLHATITRAVVGICAAAGLEVPSPQAAFYLYPDFEPWRDHLRARHQVTTSAELARLLLAHYGAATLPASAFGEDPAALRLRLATGLLYGDTQQQRTAALTAPSPLAAVDRRRPGQGGTHAHRPHQPRLKSHRSTGQAHHRRTIRGSGRTAARSAGTQRTRNSTSHHKSAPPNGAATGHGSGGRDRQHGGRPWGGRSPPHAGNPARPGWVCWDPSGNRTRAHPPTLPAHLHATRRAMLRRRGVTVMFVWVAIGGITGLLGLADLADFLLARAGKRSVLHRQLTEDQLARARQKLGETGAESTHSPFKYGPGGGGPPGV